MFSQEKLPFNPALFLVFWLIFLAGCYTIFSVSDDEDREPRTPRPRAEPTALHEFQPAVLQAPPDEIKSLQIYHGEDRTAAPILDLDDPDSFLTLRFDKLGTRSRMFRVRISHYSADWEKSNIPRSFYLSGFQQTEISGSTASNVQNPAYQHYHYTFPDGFNFELSGNYLLEVYSYEDDRLLFSLPFFVTEDQGSLATQIEPLYTGAAGHRLTHQPFATFRYPEFVRSPETNIKIYFTQNQFWGRSRKATVPDFTEVDRIRTYIPREHSFPGQYEFRELDVRILQPDGRRIIEYRPELIPPRIYLFRDIVDLNVQPYARTSHRYGQILSDRNARYVEVKFELELPEDLQTENPIYIIGPFNNWKLQESNRMHFDSETGNYQGTAVVKQGVYDYKYVVKQRDGVDEFRLDATFFDGIQEYHTKTYYHDPQYRADRLLKIDRKTIRSR